MHEPIGGSIKTAGINIDNGFVDPALIPIHYSRILHSLGVPGEKADDYLLELIISLSGRCKEICTPRLAVTLFENPSFIHAGYLVKVNQEAFSVGPMVYNALCKSTSLAVFVGTCGDQIELLSKNFMKEGQSLEGFIVDLIGSEYAEGLAELTHQMITDKAASLNKRTTNRYSPGYCNWTVAEQKNLFNLMNKNCAGIKLTSSSLMIPIKSVSGIIGLGEHVENRGYSCAVCDTAHCLYRDKK